MKSIFFLFGLFLVLSLYGQDFPGKTWDSAKPSEFNFSDIDFQYLGNFISENLETSSLLVVHKGRIVFSYGNVSEKQYTRSARKSFMSAVYGKYVENKLIDTTKTLKDLKITEITPLNENENRATVRNCLMARSGVYLPSEAQSAAMDGPMPSRGSYLPGQFWSYNNWDFNVLATVLTNCTGKDFFKVLKNDIAEMIGMEHFQIEDGFYAQGKVSIHPAYHFKISALDFARFGLLMLKEGNWNGEQVLPTGWVNEITHYYSDAQSYQTDGYGMMWWVAKSGNKYPHYPVAIIPDGSYSARGAYGQHLVIIPDYDLVIVHQVNSDKNDKMVSLNSVGIILNMILKATKHPSSEIACLKYKNIDFNRIAGKYKLREGVFIDVTFENNKLYLQRTGLPKELLIQGPGNILYTSRNTLVVNFYNNDKGVQLIDLKQMGKIQTATSVTTGKM